MSIYRTKQDAPSYVISPLLPKDGFISIIIEKKDNIKEWGRAPLFVAIVYFVVCMIRSFRLQVVAQPFVLNA
jgi:hypothetical protein